MPNFFYTAKSSDGQTKIGNLYAEDLASLAQTLRGEKLFLIEAVLTDQKDGVKAKFALPSFGVSSVEKIIMTRNLWVMFSAGLSLVKIFDILSSQTKKQKLKSIMLDIRERIKKVLSRILRSSRESLFLIALPAPPPCLITFTEAW